MSSWRMTRIRKLLAKPLLQPDRLSWLEKLNQVRMWMCRKWHVAWSRRLVTRKASTSLKRNHAVCSLLSMSRVAISTVAWSVRILMSRVPATKVWCSVMLLMRLRITCLWRWTYLIVYYGNWRRSVRKNRIWCLICVRTLRVRLRLNMMITVSRCVSIRLWYLRSMTSLSVRKVFHRRKRMRLCKRGSPQTWRRYWFLVWRLNIRLMYRLCLMITSFITWIRPVSSWSVVLTVIPVWPAVRLSWIHTVAKVLMAVVLSLERTLLR